MAEQLSEGVDRQVYEGLEIIDDLYLHISDQDIVYPKQMAAALYYISMQHSVGALMLLKGMAHAPAFALGRPIFETYVRATWLHFVANEAEHTLAENDHFPKLNKLVDALKVTPYGRSVVSRYEGIGVLHSFTHGGSAQINGHIQNKLLAPSFTENDQELLVEWAVRTAITSAMQLAILIDQHQIVLDINRKLPERYAGKSNPLDDNT
jgi:hypothetical protein